MITEIRANNCYVFDKPTKLTLEADMRIKKFHSNVYSQGNFNVLKTIGIYGSNNAGKTNLIKVVAAILSILKNKGFIARKNIFSQNSIIDLGISFLNKEKKYSYDFKFDVEKQEFIYEKFQEITKDIYGNETSKSWLVRDTINNSFESIDEKMSAMASIVARNNIIMYLVDTTQFEYINKMKKILTDLANKIDIVDMNNIPIERTFALLKNKDSDSNRKIVDFIKNADLYMDNYYLANPKDIKIEMINDESRPQENVLNIPNQLFELMRLTSVYKGISVPSLLFDSTGTKKIVALASYIIEALEKGKILIIDELDSSIHFKLSRAIISMFNNEANNKAQLIVTVHDISLMDCKKLFRKEQIWFVHKDKSGVYVYSLADFTAQEGIRNTTDVVEKYKKGALGALPEPDLINTLLELETSEVE